MIGARSALGCLLALILLFGSVMGAVARNEWIGVTTVTLCGTEGAAALQIDAGGNPVKADHSCPAGVAVSAMVALVAPQAVLALTRVGSIAFHPDAAVPVLQSHWRAAHARGPPALV